MCAIPIMIAALPLAQAAAAEADRYISATVQQINQPENRDRSSRYDNDEGRLTQLSFTVLRKLH